MIRCFALVDDDGVSLVDDLNGRQAMLVETYEVTDEPSSRPFITNWAPPPNDQSM